MQEPSVVNVNFGQGRNVGDHFSPPARYCGSLGDVFDIGSAPEADVTIYGGGTMALEAAAHARKRSGIKIAWGVGHTERGRMGRHVDPSYDAFDLAGVRDWGIGREDNTYWVPCASCMSPLFDQEYEITKEVAFYGHALLSPMVGEDSLQNDCMDMAKVIAHLGSAETIVTSSYHGVYWATLLGRKVVAIPYGSKFFALRHQPTFVDRYEGQAGRSHPEALAECRAANLSFSFKVLDLTQIGGE